MINPNNDTQHDADLILLNRMYVGEFLNENIGFESINLVKADDGKNYIYVTPYGTMDIDKYKKVKTILFVRKYAPGTYQIIAKAENLRLAEEIEDYINNKNNYGDIRQLQQTKIEKIKFSSVSYKDIFENNRTKTKSNNKINGAFYTYTGKVTMANKILIISKTDFVYDSKKLFRSSLKMFIDKQSTPNAYNKLEEYIEDHNKENWKDETQKIKVKRKLKNNSNFISILGKEDDELSFSNLFAYIFRTYKELFFHFYIDILSNSKNFKNEQLYKYFDFSQIFKVEREINNIDIKLTDDKGNVIVIENKIKSNINGVNLKNEDHFHKIESQLSKYYNIVKNETETKNVKASFFIFYPEYHEVLKNSLPAYLDADKYVLVSYKNIYGYYKKWFDDNKKNLSTLPRFYFDQFLNSLKKHTESVDNQLEEELKLKFNNRIFELRQSSKS